MTHVPIRTAEPRLRGTRLRRIGHLARADSAGRLPRLGRAPEGPMGASVHRFAEALHARIGDPDLSVVLRGSLARGSSSAADVDLMLITPDPPELPPLDMLPPLPLPVEASLVPLDRFDNPDRGAWPRFSLAHAGWTLAGPDRLTELPAPCMGPVVIAHLRGVRRWWPCHPEDWASSLGERRLINGWLAKRILRSLAEGEMLRRGVYSRDVWPCLQLACLAFPASVDLLTQVAEEIVRPTGTPAARARLLAARPLLEWAHARHLRRRIALPR